MEDFVFKECSWNSPSTLLATQSHPHTGVPQAELELVQVPKLRVSRLNPRSRPNSHLGPWKNWQTTSHRESAWWETLQRQFTVARISENLSPVQRFIWKSCTESKYILKKTNTLIYYIYICKTYDRPYFKHHLEREASFGLFIFQINLQAGKYEAFLETCLGGARTMAFSFKPRIVSFFLLMQAWSPQSDVLTSKPDVCYVLPCYHVHPFDAAIIALLKWPLKWIGWLFFLAPELDDITAAYRLQVLTRRQDAMQIPTPFFSEVSSAESHAQKALGARIAADMAAACRIFENASIRAVFAS